MHSLSRVYSSQDLDECSLLLMMLDARRKWAVTAMTIFSSSVLLQVSFAGWSARSVGVRSGQKSETFANSSLPLKYLVTLHAKIDAGLRYCEIAHRTHQLAALVNAGVASTFQQPVSDV
jgi:hypothetical protein